MARKIYVRWTVTEEFEGVFDADDLGIEVDEADFDENEADFDTDALADFEAADAGNYLCTPDRSVAEFQWQEG